ncbi:MAG: electron transport complex subunit E [Staphylococcus sp.]|jgi:electron transport complex, rnfABCDGE type, E subunit|nr:electron transport complex subunit E [Staphylococcus sp.]
MNYENKLSVFLKGLVKENPVLVLILGTCPTLAMSSNVISALAMGVSATLVLLCSNVVISLLRKVIPDQVRIPSYIVIIAGFVTMVQMLLHAYLPDLYQMLGVYLALIVVNCIILGRAEMYASKNNVLNSALDGLGMGIGFTLALFVIATIREVFGNASFANLEIKFLQNYKIAILTQAPGGFFVYGCMIALVNKITKGKAIKKKDFSCNGCPSANFCKKGVCEEEVNQKMDMEKEAN